jgi:hypothetical protein
MKTWQVPHIRMCQKNSTVKWGECVALPLFWPLFLFAKCGIIICTLLVMRLVPFMDLKLACFSCGQNILVDSSAGGTTVTCPNCSTQLSVPVIVASPGSSAVSPAVTPPRNAWLRRTPRVALYLLGIAVGSLLVLHLLIYLFGHSQQDEAADAYYVAKRFCEQYAPSATRFTTLTGADYLDGRAEWVTNNGRADWFACGYVDCQNRYGALRHQPWGAHVILRGDKWRCTFLEIGTETFIGGD